MNQPIELLLAGGTAATARDLAERVFAATGHAATVTAAPDLEAAERAQHDDRYDIVVAVSPGPERDPALSALLELNRPIGAGPIFCWWPADATHLEPCDAARLDRLALAAVDRRGMGPLADDLERRYHSAFDHAASGLALISTEGRLLEVNRALTRIVGYRPDQLVGRTPVELTHPDDVDPSVNSFRDIAKLRLSRYEAEKRYLHRDGSVVWVHLVVSAVLDERGRAIYFIAQVSDISRRKASELEAGRSKRLVEAIRRIQARYIGARDPQLLHRVVARQLARLTDSPDHFSTEVELQRDGSTSVVVQSVGGRFEQTENGLQWTGFGSRRTPLQPVVAELLERGQVQAFEGADSVRALGLPGPYAELNRIALVPIALEGERLALIGLAGAQRPYARALLEWIAPVVATSASVLGSLRQSLRRERAEQRLLESQRTLLTLMHNLPGMAYRCENDANRTLTFASEGCIDLTGYAPEDLVDAGRLGFAELIHPDDRKSVNERIRWALIQREPFELEYRVHCRDGSEKWIWEQGSGVLDDRGETLFVEGFLTDVTAKHRAEEERLRLEARVQQGHKLESLGVLAGGIAHDFNNLLMGILGHAGLAGRHVDPQHPVYSSLAEIESAALRAARLTDHMLAFTGRGPLRPRPLELSESILGAAPVLEKLLPQQVRLELELGHGLPKIESDPRQLQQMLVQLVRNAAEAIGEVHGTVTIETAHVTPGSEVLDQTVIGQSPEAGEFVSLTVTDSGAGMADDVKSRAFDPFFTTKGFGRGLGLSSVLGIVRSHGGHVQLRSSRVTGTSLRLLFPLLGEIPLDPALPPHELVPHPSRRELRRPEPGRADLVLVVDDEQIVRGVATAMLEEAGYRVISARDGQEGLARFTEHADEVRAVLLDMSMPRLDGESALLEMRKVRPDVRILLTSGFSEQDAMHRIARRRGVGFIQKPYRAGDLLEQLSEVLHA